MLKLHEVVFNQASMVAIWSAGVPWLSHIRSKVTFEFGMLWLT